MELDRGGIKLELDRRDTVLGLDGRDIECGFDRTDFEGEVDREHSFAELPPGRKGVVTVCCALDFWLFSFLSL